MGSDLATTADPPMLRVLWFRVETPDDHWIPPDDINSSWPRLHSPKVNEGEASMDVIVIMNLWATSDFQERLDGNRGSSVTLERQMTSRKDWRGCIRLATSCTALARGHQPKLRKIIRNNTPRVAREGGRMSDSTGQTQR